MEKLADLHYPVHAPIARRWSPRAFVSRPVEPALLQQLFEAARWAASCFNEQPWSFIVATQETPDAYARLFACLSAWNQQWAQQAPVLLLAVAQLRFTRNNRENRHALYDVGMAVENLVLQATHLDLFAHQMAGFDMDKARADCALPEDYTPVTMIALGYPGDPDTLSAELRELEFKPRTRKPITDFVFTGRWGDSSPLVTP